VSGGQRGLAERWVSVTAYTDVESRPLTVLVAAPSASVPRERKGAPAWLLASILGGLTIVEGVREGGFWPADAFVVAVAASLVLAVQVVGRRPGRRVWMTVGSLLLLDLWWLGRAVTVGPIESFLPLGASIVGFAAAFATAARLEPRGKEITGQAIAALGALGALIGFAGLIWRWFPMAMPAQGLWRLSSTVTYSDAAGLVLAVCLLVGLAGGPRPWVARISVCLCAGGLLAAQSRGAYVAFAVGCVVAPLRQYRLFLVPLLAGVALGIAAIKTSPSPHAVPWLAAAVICAVALSAAPSPPAKFLAVVRSQRFAVGCIVIVGLVTAVVVLHHEIGLRAFAPSDQDRAVEWSAAAHQFASSPLVGVGPDRLLQFHAVDGTYAHFAHNEYLQVAADAGLIGLALLVLAGLSLVRAVRRVDLVTSCATAALVCWAVGGAFDFDWHLPFVGLLGGWVAGLATRRNT
jgi:hypothetical protein